MSAEDFEEFTQQWSDLQYYKSSDIECKSKVFNAKTTGLFIFSKIYRFIEGKMEGEFHVSEEKWKMNFTLKGEAEPIEKEEGDEEDDLEPDVPQFDVEVRLYAADPEDQDPSDIQVQVHRAKGDLVAFNKWYKTLMEQDEEGTKGGLGIFVHPEGLEA